MSRRMQWDYAVLGLHEAIRRACDPTFPLSQAYYGDAIGRAVWQAKHVVREARALGLYPSTQQLEAESRKAA